MMMTEEEYLLHLKFMGYTEEEIKEIIARNDAYPQEGTPQYYEKKFREDPDYKIQCVLDLLFNK